MSFFTSSALIESAKVQSLPLSGTKIVFSGFKILTDSAMKSTPQNKIVFSSIFVAILAKANESPITSAIPKIISAD